MKRLLLAGCLAVVLFGPARAQSPNPQPTTNTPCGVLTRPADTNAYASGDLIASSTTAGSVVVPSCIVARFPAGASGPNSGIVTRFRLATNVTTGWGSAVITLNFWSAAPTYTNGDNGAYAVATGAAGYLGQVSVTLTQFGDGAAGQGAWAVGNFAALRTSVGQVIYWDMQVAATLTPISGQTFTLVPEELTD